MLMLTREAGSKIAIGDDVIVTIVHVGGEKVRVGIDAPRDVAIVRTELLPDTDPRSPHYRGPVAPFVPPTHAG